jgi:hypothetical protein
MLDTTKLRADLRALAHECRARKDLLGATWTRPMADEQRRLARLRWRVTELCVLRAWSRGRRHCAASRPAGEEGDAWHAKIAERVAKDYERSVEASTEGAAR